MRCGFCGREFSEELGASACANCPLSKLKGSQGCGHVKCPYCGYENPQETKFEQKLRTWSWRKRSQTDDTHSLANLPKGVPAKICQLDKSSAKDLQKLLAFGIMPGQSVEVIQRYPTIVVKVGRTTVALDKQVAAQVFVCAS